MYLRYIFFCGSWGQQSVTLQEGFLLTVVLGSPGFSAGVVSYDPASCEGTIAVRSTSLGSMKEFLGQLTQLGLSARIPSYIRKEMPELASMISVLGNDCKSCYLGFCLSQENKTWFFMSGEKRQTREARGPVTPPFYLPLEDLLKLHIWLGSKDAQRSALSPWSEREEDFKANTSERYRCVAQNLLARFSTPRYRSQNGPLALQLQRPAEGVFGVMKCDAIRYLCEFSHDVLERVEKYLRSNTQHGDSFPIDENL
jgi:hypothetical protein